MVDPSTRPPSTTTLPPETLAGIEIVVGGWDVTCSTMPCWRMPKLQLLAYAAGSVKHTVTPATWQHGISVSSAAAANAVPVAEFTFAAIVMIAKDVFRIRDRHREARGREAVTGVGPTGELGTRGLRVGVIGASAIGRLVIARLRSLEVSTAVSDPYLDGDGVRSMGATLMDGSTISSRGPTSSPCTRPRCRRPITWWTPNVWHACTTAPGCSTRRAAPSSTPTP
jgi:phosphoglycerate dehydrogenase-like enzyme